MSGRIARVALGLGLSLVYAPQLSAAGFFEMNFWLSGPRYDRVMPACDHPAALDQWSPSPPVMHGLRVSWSGEETFVLLVENQGGRTCGCASASARADCLDA